MKEGVFEGAHQAKTYQEALLGLDKTFYSRVLNCKLERNKTKHFQFNTQSVLRKEAESSYSKKHPFLRRTSSACLAYGLAQDGNPPDVPGLDKGYQVVWTWERSFLSSLEGCL